MTEFDRKSIYYDTCDPFIAFDIDQSLNSIKNWLTIKWWVISIDHLINKIQYKSNELFKSIIAWDESCWKKKTQKTMNYINYEFSSPFMLNNIS